MRISCLFLVLVLCGLIAQAQTMMGYVRDAYTGKPLYPVVVVNESTQEAVTTNDSGLYVISARTGDVMAFSYVGYQTVEHRKPTSIIVASININMEPQQISLPEFKFKIDKRTKYQVDSEERRTIYKLALERTHPSPIMSPASAIAEMFSKKAKMVYKFQENFYNGEVEKFVDIRYTPSLVAKMTGFTGDTIGHFMYSYPMPYQFARTATDLELKMWIRTNYREYLKSPAYLNPKHYYYRDTLVEDSLKRN